MIIGMDIGTHWARAAYLDRDGAPQLVPLADGRTALPAAARQSLLGLEVGADAALAQAGNVETTVIGCTRLLGRPTDLPPRVLERLPYGVRIEGGAAVCNLVYAEVPAATIYGSLARTLAEAATRVTGQPVDGVVLTVPASADDRFRVHARAAVEAMGLRVHRLVNQPTAALLAARLPSTAQTVAVVYCGDGATDVTLARRDGDRIAVLATAGDPWLGGEDMIWRVADGLNERFRTQAGVDVYGVGDGPAAAWGLRHAAADALTALRHSLKTTVVIDHGGGFAQDLVTVLHRQEADAWLAEQLCRVAALCGRALGSSGLDAAAVDAVLLVGDWTDLLCLRVTIADAFARPVADLRVIDAAALPALGAARLSAQPGRLAWDVTPYPLGINCYYGDRELFSPIIKANTPAPTPPLDTPGAATEPYQTLERDQKSVTLEILQYRGEDDPDPRGPTPVLPRDCERLGVWEFEGLRPKKGQRAAFTVSFAIDESGILHLAARETATGHTLRAHVDRSIG